MFGCMLFSPSPCSSWASACGIPPQRSPISGPSDSEVELLRRRRDFARMGELIPKSYVVPLDFEKIFGRTAPLQVDLGCGDGSFLAALAAQTPQKNFLGIERLVGRVRTAVRKAARLENVSVLQLETSYAIRYLLPARSVEVFHLLFPDPWPKRRHASRRIVTDGFLESLHRGLVPGGTLQIATDQFDYFTQIERLAAASRHFQPLPEFPAAVAVTT